MSFGNKFQIDMCHGPLFKKIILFAVPLTITNVLQLLFQATDLVVLGQFADKGSMAAVGATGGFTVLILNIFFGISVGANVLAARYTGAKDNTRLSRTIHTAAAIALYGGIVITVIGLLISRPVLQMMSTPADILDNATLYMQLYCIGIPFIIFYNFGNAILRALGDTRRPLIFMIVAGVVKVLLNLLFVPVFHWGIWGVGFSTMISNALASLLAILTLVSARDASRLFWKGIKFNGEIFKEMLRIGIPAGIQGSFFSLSTLVIQSSVNTFGAAAIEGNAASGSIESIVYVACSVYYYTAISFVGQNSGAHKYKRIARSIGWCFVCSFVVSFLLGWGVYIFGVPLLKIYSTDPEVIRWGMIRLKILLTLYFLCGFMDVISGALRGLGHSIKPTIVTLLGVCVLRIAWVFWLFPLHPTMENLMVSYPVSWTVVSLVNGAILYWVCRKLFRNAADNHYLRLGSA